MKELIQKTIAEHLAVTMAVNGQLIEQIAEVGKRLIATLEAGNKILLCGNGGSAADAQHIAAEMTGRYLAKNRRPLPAIALTTDTSALTAIGNDFGIEQIFSRQVEALGKKGDFLIAISTSGNSSNVLAAAATARRAQMTVIGITGGNGGELKAASDLALIVPSSHTPHIQEMHILIAHILCDLVDRHFAIS
ncbi:MAG: D-sedoheptulose 7-phosphate isomerase [bacterium]|nr:D-sedoheptulose 7-phosphate isomerase [bacterium]